MEREAHTASPGVFQICLEEIKEDSFQHCRPTACSTRPAGKLDSSISHEQQHCRSTIHCSTHHPLQKKKKSSSFNPWQLCQVHSYPDGSAGEGNDISSLSQELPHPSHVSLETTPSPAVFAHNPHLLQAPNLLGAILDREGR